MKAMSVRNPWAWALCVQRPRGGPLKTAENRTQRMAKRHNGKWTLIHCGTSHRPAAESVSTVISLARRAMVRVPDWAHKPVGAIIGAVRFDRCIPVEAALGDPVLEPWINPEASFAYVVGASVLFPESQWMECKGRQSVFWTPPEDIVAAASVLVETAARAAKSASADGDPTTKS